MESRANLPATISQIKQQPSHQLLQSSHFQPTQPTFNPLSTQFTTNATNPPPTEIRVESSSNYYPNVGLLRDREFRVRVNFPSLEIVKIQHLGPDKTGKSKKFLCVQAKLKNSQRSHPRIEICGYHLRLFGYRQGSLRVHDKVQPRRHRRELEFHPGATRETVQIHIRGPQ